MYYFSKVPSDILKNKEKISGRLLSTVSPRERTSTNAITRCAGNRRPLSFNFQPLNAGSNELPSTSVSPLCR